MLRTNNPVLSRSDTFTGRPNGGRSGQTQAGYPGYPQSGYPQAGYPQGGFPQGGYPQPGYGPSGYSPEPREGVMTLDDVLTKTGIVMGVLVAVAAAAWFLIPDAFTGPALIVSALVGFVTVLLVTFRRTVSPPMTLLYAAFEGVFIGMFSKIFERIYPGIVVQAVVATFVVAGVVLVAYRIGGFRLSSRVRKITVIATAAFAGVMLLNFVMALVGFPLGLRAGVTGPVSGLAVLVSLVAVVLAALNLVMDFEMVDTGIRSQAPASQSWVAAFGLTVTMVWLYTELLRIISYLRR